MKIIKEHVDIGAVESKLNKLGYHLSNYLGAGVCGKAFKISSDRVLKITDDDSEADAMNIIMYHPHPNIVKVYRVFKFSSEKDCYFEEEELLEPIDENKINKWLLYTIIQEAEDSPYYKNILSILTYYSQSRTVTKNYDIEGIVKRMVDKHEFINRKYKVEKMSKGFHSFFVDMLSAAKHIYENGIRFHDWHSGNIMQKNGRYMLIDLGASISPQQKIEILEREMKLKQIIKEDQKDRYQQVKRMIDAGVKFDPPLMMAQDELVEQIFSQWMQADSKHNCTIKWDANYSTLKLSKFEIV